MNNNPEVIVIKEKRENVDKMKQELAKKEKQYTTLKNVGEALSAFGTPVLIGSLLSPFDFDGPIIEIVSGVVLIAGTIMKKVAQNELDCLPHMQQHSFPFSPQTDSIVRECRICSIHFG